MKVLVTGGAGYIGSVLTTKLLKEGYKVDVLDSLVFGGQSLLPHIYNPDFKLIYGSIISIDRKFIEKYDAILHLAAVGFTQGGYMEEQINNINYECTKILVDLCKKYNKRLLFSSTCSNYGETIEIATEESKLNPTNAYARSKARAEEYILKNYPSAVILRLSTVFGLSPRMRFDTLVNEFVLNAVMSNYIRVYNYNAWRPYIHIDDVANAFLFFLENEEKGVYNVGDNALNYTKRDICKIIRKFVPNLNVELVGEIDEARNYRVSFDKINDIGFKTKRTVEEGIAEIKKALDNHVFPDPYSYVYRNIEVYKKYYSKIL